MISLFTVYLKLFHASTTSMPYVAYVHNTAGHSQDNILKQLMVSLLLIIK